MAAKQGAHYLIHLIWPMPPPSKARTSQPYGEYSTKYQMLTTTLWPFQGVHGRLITGPLTWQFSIQPWTTAHLHNYYISILLPIQPPPLLCYLNSQDNSQRLLFFKTQRTSTELTSIFFQCSECWISVRCMPVISTSDRHLSVSHSKT